MTTTPEELKAALEQGRLHEVAPNAEQIRSQATRVVGCRVPQSVRQELRLAVKAGLLGHLPKDGLKPEIFFHPDHLHAARERQNREALYAVGCISKVMVSPAEVREELAKQGIDPLDYLLAKA